MYKFSRHSSTALLSQNSAYKRGLINSHSAHCKTYTLHRSANHPQRVHASPRRPLLSRRPASSAPPGFPRLADAAGGSHRSEPSRVNVSPSADSNRRRSTDTSLENTRRNAASFVRVFQTNTDEHSATRNRKWRPSNNDRSLGQLRLVLLHHLCVSAGGATVNVRVEAKRSAATLRAGTDQHGMGVDCWVGARAALLPRLSAIATFL